MQLQNSASSPSTLSAPGNVYMRCANDSRTDLAGRLFMAMGAPALPCWPDQLQTLPAPIGAAHGEGAAPLAALRTVHALKDFFAANPGYAQRSVAFGIADRYRFKARFQQREAAAEMHLELRVHGCHPGWSYSVTGEDPDVPLRLDTFETTDGSAWMSVAALVPAGHDDMLTLRIDTHGCPAPPEARVDLVLSVRLPVVVNGVAQPTLFRLGCHSWRAHPPVSDATPRR